MNEAKEVDLVKRSSVKSLKSTSKNFLLLLSCVVTTSCTSYFRFLVTLFFLIFLFSTASPRHQAMHCFEATAWSTIGFG